MTRQPMIPDYAGANVRGIIPALLGPSTWNGTMPSWMPEPVTGARQGVLLILDGLGWEQFLEHRKLMPVLAGMTGEAISTVAPTTTATALSSIATGLTPAEHGLLGYRMMLGGEVLNVLRWISSSGDRRRAYPPRDVQGFPAFLGHNIPVVSPAELQGSAFTEAHLRGSRPVGYRAVSAIAVEVGEQLAAGERFVYAYYGGIDKTAHERGFGPYYEAELRFADRVVVDVLDVLPPDAVLLVTADHGQVEVGDRTIKPGADLLAMVGKQSGEGRFRWWHANSGAADELAAAARERYHDLAWIVTRQQVMDEHWFGPALAAPFAARLGDVALVAHAPVSFYDPADSGPFELVCRHGSMTSAEVLVPLLAGAKGLSMTDTPPDRDGEPASAAVTEAVEHGELVPAASVTAGDDEPGDEVTSPAKVMRIGSMTKMLLEEVRAAPLDEPSRERLAEIYERSIVELSDALSPDLQQELKMLALPFRDGVVPTEGEIRVAKAQLVGWLEGLFHGIQATLFAQQLAARQQLEQMRQLPTPGAGGVPGNPQQGDRPGTYL